MVSVVCILDGGRCRGPNSGERCMYTRQVGGGVDDQTVVSVVCILDRWGGGGGVEDQTVVSVVCILDRWGEV